MFKRFQVLLLLVLVAIIFSSSVTPALAQGEDPEPPAPDGEVTPEVAVEDSDGVGRLLEFLGVLAGLVPVVGFGGPLIAYLVDQIKRVGLPNGYAPLVAAAGNLLLFGVVFFVGPEKENDVRTAVDGIYKLAPFVVGFIVTAILAARSHDQLVTTGQGFSHTQKEEDKFEPVARGWEPVG